MSWSFKLSNGDLVYDGAQYGTVRGVNKLTQDLRCALLEKMGTDPAHLGFGSILDGGRLPNGTEVGGVIGQTNWPRMALLIESEIRRIARNYQDYQLDRARSDRMTYNNVTLDQNEILARIDHINFTQVQDTLLVQVSLRTAAGSKAGLIVPITNIPPLVT